MNRDDFKKLESEEEFALLLKKHDLFREDDVTFEDLGEDNIYLYSGDDFRVDAEMLAAMEISALLVDGTVRVDSVSVSEILPDYGVFCVTGDLQCKDMLYVTESTGVGIGGNLVIENFYYADCGNSVLQVNKNLSAKLFFNSQCSVEVKGQENCQFDESVSREEIESLGLAVPEDTNLDDAIRAYLKR